MSVVRQVFSRLLQWVLTGMLLVMALVTFAQIISRYLLKYPLVWSEELSLLLMVWITFLGSVLVLERHEHIGIDLLVEKVPQTAKRAVQIVGFGLVFLFNCVLTYGGFVMVNKTIDSITPGLKVSVGWQYGGVLLGGLLLAMVSLEQFIRAWIDKEQKGGE